MSYTYSPLLLFSFQVAMQHHVQSNPAESDGPAVTLPHELDPTTMLHLLNETTGAALCSSAEALRTNPDVATPQVQHVIRTHVHVSGPEKQKIMDDINARMDRDRIPQWCTACGLRDPAVLYHPDIPLTGDPRLSHAISHTCHTALHLHGALHVLGFYSGSLCLAVDLEDLLLMAPNLKQLRDRLRQVPMYDQMGVAHLTDMSGLVHGWTSPHGNLLGLHADHVGTDSAGQPTMTLCSKCYKCLKVGEDEEGKTPRLALAAGVDYGNLSDTIVQQYLKPLRDIEKLVLANTRTYGVTIKISAPSVHQQVRDPNLEHSVLHCHFISFFHDGPTETVKRLDLLQQAQAVTNSIQFVLVGPGHCRDKLMRKLRSLPELTGRAWVMLNYALIRGVVNNEHPDRLGLPGVAELQAAAEALLDRLDHDARHITDTSIEEHAAKMAADVTGVRDVDAGEESWTNDEAEHMVDVKRVALLKNGVSAGEMLEKTLHEIDQMVCVERAELPVNEFTANDILIAETFWDVFLLGGEGLKKGTQATSFVRHLLCQHDNKAAQDANLLFLLANQSVPPTHPTSEIPHLPSKFIP